MTWNRFFISVAVTVFAAVGLLAFRDIKNFSKENVISFAFLPGELSKSHAFLENQCTTCHTANQGVSAVGCISCHANNSNLLQRQTTAFHANVTSCKECHQEHQGGVKPKLFMDHLALAKLGLQEHQKNSSDFQNQLVRTYLTQKHIKKFESESISINPNESPLVSSLSCMGCHATKDRHQGKFGTSCLSCHSSDTWRISEYKHPSVNSRDCAQCHKEPPSHNMMHFEMISKMVAGQKHAKVNQCFLCHQTTSWNDIKGKGWYKHH